MRIEGNTTTLKGRFSSHLKVRRMITMFFINHIVRVRDMDVEQPVLQYIVVVSEFLNVFPDELSNIPPQWEFDFAILILFGTEPIYTPYRKAPVELKELKDRLKYLLDNGFIKPSASQVFKYFLKIYLRSKYHQVHVRRKIFRRHFFRTIYGNFEF